MEKKEQANQIRNIFTRVCLKGSHELRNTLEVDEDGFQMVRGPGHHNTRDFYIYGVLDEIEKVGVALKRYEELLSDSKEAEISDRITRNIISSILDEQNLWIRKLNEILVEVLLFQETNTKEHYRHYLLVRELDSFRKLCVDFNEFYDCDNENIKNSISSFASHITNVEKSLDMSRCWYLKSNKASAKREFSDFRSRFRKAIAKCNPDQKMTLGLSYGSAYTGPSRGVHANIGGPVYDISLKRVELNRCYLGLLAANILLVCRKLLRTKPKGILEQFDRVFRTSDNLEELFDQTTRPTITKGDFVLAYGDLAEIVKVNKSKYGYKSFKVRYLAKPPIPSIPEDCFPAPAVRLLYKRKDLAKEIKEEIKEHMVGVSDAKLNKMVAKALRETAIDLWENWGLRESAMGRPDLMREKIAKNLESNSS